jgi:uracil-DNA glycosylase
MKLTRLHEFYESEVFPRPSTKILFNQFRDELPGYDIRGGAKIRRENLKNYLRTFKRTPKLLLVGEAPGPWGARFSGVPFSGEGPLSRGELPFTGSATSTSEQPYSERAGKIFWGLLAIHHPDFFIWNSIPYHPHQLGKPLSLRTPKWSEVKNHLPLLEDLLTILKPRAIASIGRVAEKALTEIGRKSTYIRHPSHGGVKLFENGITKFISQNTR